MRFLQTTTILVFLAVTSFAQLSAEERPVLKALPLDFEETTPTIEKSIPPTDAELVSPEASTPAPAPAPAVTEPTAVPIDPLAVAEPSPINLKPKGDDAVRLQIFLDQSNFGPGVIDGRPGKFTELAVRSWNEHHGHPLDSWTAVNIAARKAVPNPFAVAIVPQVSEKWVNPNLSYKKAEQAKAKQMSYRSIGEFMSERYHTDVPYLIELNSSSKIYGLRPGNSIVVPNVAAFQIENLTGAAFKEDEDLSQRHAVVDTKLNQVRIYEANLRALVVADPESPASVANHSLVAAFPITPGKPQFIRYGKWEMKNAVELPVWRYDQQLLDTGVRGKKSLNIPGGPNNPVGVLWCGLSKPGIGMHGTSDPETIGRSQSSGCIRLANWDIVRIPGLLRPGCSVEIR